MTTLKLHYDGWLALPADLRHMLDLKTGDRLRAELVDGAIVLRPTQVKRAPAEPEPVAEIPGGVAAAAVDSMAVPVKRPRGRPRKVQVDPTHPELLPGLEMLPASPKRKPGRPRKVRAEEVALDPAPETPAPGDEAVVWKLRPKAALPEVSPDPVPNAPPPRRREPSWGSSGGEREERRPFRNVEVRKLGPGRQHNRSRQTTGS
ncbi:MAG: hypothetical protein WAS21_02550 [Geminicoccaceae bacterium]